ncbi:hypothetical protein A3Q56_05546 [Intoshia linei]|uniref:Alpha-1,4-N-acetylglucosaminyltransferase n=1 Tax=Intoshia linei TaxID=1819745 RepID=A0A177AZD8_9BILA|nr:hypothetical protein A3Q56_05546 [Intoshia linei]
MGIEYFFYLKTHEEIVPAHGFTMKLSYVFKIGFHCMTDVFLKYGNDDIIKCNPLKEAILPPYKFMSSSHFIIVVKIFKNFSSFHDYHKTITRNFITHQIDILRIFILLEYGGIYIDNDIITMKKLDDSVLEALNSDVAIFGIDSLKTTKSSIVASNAFIGCYNCTFLHILLDSYKDFRQDIYDYNSGINLVLLVVQNTKKAKILNNLIITPKNPNTRQIINLKMYNSYHLQMHRNNLDLDNFSNPNSTISKNSTLYKIMKLYI